MSISSQVDPNLHSLQGTFLSILMPKIESHGQIQFRHIRCADTRQECIGEMLALSWMWCIRLVQRGKDPTQFPSVLASFAARAVRSGRRLCGQLKAKDVLSERAQKQKGFRVENLSHSSCTSFERLHRVRGQQHLDTFEERLRDNRQTPVPEQVAFRCDFPAWLADRSDRDQQIILDMLREESTSALARKYGVSSARISQLRREYHQDWQAFENADT